MLRFVDRDAGHDSGYNLKKIIPHSGKVYSEVRDAWEREQFEQGCSKCEGVRKL